MATVPEYDIEDGLETWSFRSALTAKQHHYLSRMDNGPWRVSPFQPDLFERDLTLEEARTFAAEILHIVRTAERLEREARKKVPNPVDAAIIAEVIELMASKEWPVEVAAAEFGMTRQQLAHRLGGHSSWTLGDLTAIAKAYSVGNEQVEEEVFQYLASLGFKASAAKR